ncbi:MAG: flagellin, partial [Clostridiales bacterium]|nr:flagellin [Clostridiales bacterium]MDN5281123.1 flagellin [Candidatus Ozemobacter sp.]
MSLRINQNVLSIGTYSSVAKSSSRLEKSIQKLSSGLRINSAADDAAGLAISEKMRRQIRGLNRAVLNAQDGISMIQTAEGALNESQSILHRMRELAIQSSNDTLTSNDRLEIQKEVVQLRDDLNRIARNTEFNTKKLLDGSQTALISASSSSAKGMVSGSLNGAGGDYDVNVTLLRGGIAEMQRSQIFTINDGTGALASGGTQLQSIAQFYDSNGVFVLDTPQIITLNGNGNSTSITLDGQMTLDNLSAEIQNAVVSKSGLGIENSRSATVNTIQTQIAGLGGYIQIISGSIGDSGRVSLASDQKVVDALGFSVSREAVENRVEVSIKDNFGNVRKVKTEGSVANSLLNGVDLKFTSQAAQIAGTQGLEEGIRITGAATSFEISAGGSVITVNVGAGLHSMEGLARLINTTAVGVAGLNASVVEGELRISYERPASASATVASTVVIGNIVSQAASLGFLEGTYSGFVDGKKDQTAVEWGFSRYMATAAGDITITVRDGVNSAQLVISIATSIT